MDDGRPPSGCLPSSLDDQWHVEPAESKGVQDHETVHQVYYSIVYDVHRKHSIRHGLSGLDQYLHRHCTHKECIGFFVKGVLMDGGVLSTPQIEWGCVIDSLIKGRRGGQQQHGGIMDQQQGQWWLRK